MPQMGDGVSQRGLLLLLLHEPGNHALYPYTQPISYTLVVAQSVEPPQEGEHGKRSG